MDPLFLTFLVAPYYMSNSTEYLCISTEKKLVLHLL